MESLHGFDFFPLQFDGNGRLLSEHVWTSFKTRAKSATDAVFIAHGFRNDEGEARNLYGEFLQNLRTHLDQRQEFKPLTQRTFVVAGILWPSKAFKESFGGDGGGVLSADSRAEREQVREQLRQFQETAESSADRERFAKAMALVDGLEDPRNQDRFVDLVLDTLREAEADQLEGLDRLKAQTGSELLGKLGPIIETTAAGDDSDGGVAALAGTTAGLDSSDGSTQGSGSIAGSILGRVGQFLNLTTWYQMKERSGTVGATGVAQCVRELKQPAGDTSKIKVHLVGHSLGGRLMASCAKALAQPPAVEIDSLMLLQAAFSHYGLSADNRNGVPGFFRDVVVKKVVKGPMVGTFSFQDEVVGTAYAIASRLAGDNVRAIGDANDPFGGIGRNGAQNMRPAEFARETLHPVGTDYTFPPRVLHCLDGSGGLIKNHGDVRSAEVTYAFACAVART